MKGKNQTRGIGSIVFLAAWAGFLMAQSAAPTGGCLVASDGKGTLEFRWVPPRGQWPLGGWQLQDSQGKVLIAKVVSGEQRYQAGLSARDVETVRSLAHSIPSFQSAEQRDIFFALQVLKAYTEPMYARAIGLARTLDNVPAGPQSFRIVGLDASGRPADIVLQSGVVDSSVATPLPLAPAGLKAESQRNGVALYWTAPAATMQAPVVSYGVERPDAAGRPLRANGKPILLNTAAAAPGLPAFIDAEAPAEQDIIYRVYAFDVFGRTSPPAEVKVHHVDWQALDPPTEVKAEGSKGKIVLTWKPNGNPRTKAVYIERGFAAKGPFLPITPQSLPSTTASYDDAGVKAAATYFYRLRSAGPSGMTGEPTPPTSGRALNVLPPPQPVGLKADLGRTRVRLTWAGSDYPLVGFIVEKMFADGTWRRINGELDQTPLYDDPLGEETSGVFTYRVRAVGFDNQESESSAAIEVRIPSRAVPPPPLVIGSETKDGKAVIHFKPGLPEERTAQFVVVRGGSPSAKGIVIGRPLPATAREFTDAFVQPGLSYWYRVVAIDANGRRSKPSMPVLAVIGNSVIPPPELPKLVLLKEPFVQVRITFAAPPQGLEAVAERRTEGDKDWLRITGSTDKTELVDVDPPKIGTVYYRVVYRAANGVYGPPSPEAQIQR